MENENQKQSKFRPIIIQSISILVVDVILVVIAGHSRTSLFFLGLLMLLGGYGIEILFYGGGYVYTGKSRYRPISKYDRYKMEEGGTPGSELEKEKRAPGFLRNISVAGLLALIFSFILPWLS